jgi:hypothetical protein
MKFLGELIDADDLLLLARGAIYIGIAMLLICTIAVMAGVAASLFDLARGAG